MGGLQDTVLAETLSFNIQHGEFIQILNILENHWLPVSTVGCQPGSVNIYDSIRSISVPTVTKEQISTIMFAQQKAITLGFQPIKSQHGSSDCELFALAFATSLCHQETPVEINYTQYKLHSHLLDCFTRARSSRMRKIVKP